MNILLLMLASTVSTAPLQVLESPAFEAVVGKTEAMCPARQFRYITPADLDDVEQDFIGSLSSAEQAKLAASNAADQRCAGRNGLSCATTATLEALTHRHLTRRFAAFVCASHAIDATSATPSPSSRPQ